MSSGTTRASPALAAPPATTAIAKPDRKLREFVDRQMKLPNDAVIAREKVTNYLLVRQSRSDKSAFLESAGYTILNPDTLISDLVLLAGQNEARLVDENRFGRYYEIVGALHGPAGIRLRVRTIWMTEHLSGITKFVTLIPIETLLR